MWVSKNECAQCNNAVCKGFNKVFLSRGGHMLTPLKCLGSCTHILSSYWCTRKERWYNCDLISPLQFTVSTKLPHPLPRLQRHGREGKPPTIWWRLRHTARYGRQTRSFWNAATSSQTSTRDLETKSTAAWRPRRGADTESISRWSLVQSTLRIPVLAHWTLKFEVTWTRSLFHPSISPSAWWSQATRPSLGIYHSARKRIAWHTSSAQWEATTW